MIDFSGKRVFITGGTRGIGKAVSEKFAEHGADIAITYFKEKILAKNVINSLPGSNHNCFQLDISDKNQVQNTIEDAISFLGGLDIVINNAGIFIDHPIFEVTYDGWQDSWHSTLETNLIGPANVCYIAGSYFKKKKKGKIINISSRGANRGEPTAPAYGASKAGLNALSQSLAIALAPYNIFVGVVAPGFVETDMTTEILCSSRGDIIKSQSPLNRVGQPEEIANAVMMMAIDGMEYATGSIIDLNGASYLR